jgi:tetratricopeptide (TPR) repeat protein
MVARDSLEVYIGKVRRLSIAAVPKKDVVVTVESRNAELRVALGALGGGATAERHRRVADAYRSAGILDLAYDHFVAARDLDSRDAAAYDGLARIWRDWGVPHLGLGDARRALYYAPQSAAAHNTFGTLLDALGQREEARRAFERALALDPGAAYVWTNLCYLSFQAGDFDAASVRCRRALTLDPGFAPAHNNLALVYAATGRAQLADAEFAAVGDEASRQYNAGIVFSAGRRYADAARAFDIAGRLRPGWTIATERARQARRLAQSPRGPLEARLWQPQS